MADRIYTEVALIADLATAPSSKSISHSTFHKWRKPGGPLDFLEVGSHGSNRGEAIFSQVDSWNQFKAVGLPQHLESVAETNRLNARGRILSRTKL